MNNLYSFGCSISSINFKEKCYEQFNYPKHDLYNELIAKKLNLNLINDAYSGRGNTSIILKFAETDFKDTDFAIIQLTWSHRVELIKNHRTLLGGQTTIIQPITSATLSNALSKKLITNRHAETYMDFVNEWNDILIFTDIYNIVNSIKKKQIKYPNCKFLLITPDKIEKKIFENNLDLYENINLNGFFKDIETWKMYGKLINDDRYSDDQHFSPNGNKKLYEMILNILENE